MAQRTEVRGMCALAWPPTRWAATLSVTPVWRLVPFVSSYFVSLSEIAESCTSRWRCLALSLLTSLFTRSVFSARVPLSRSSSSCCGSAPEVRRAFRNLAFTASLFAGTSAVSDSAQVARSAAFCFRVFLGAGTYSSAASSLSALRLPFLLFCFALVFSVCWVFAPWADAVCSSSTSSSSAFLLCFPFSSWGFGPLPFFPFPFPVLPLPLPLLLV